MNTKNEQIGNIELTKKMLKLKEAFIELQEEWNKVDSPNQKEDISYGYPFAKYFNQLTLEVVTWVDLHTNSKVHGG